MEDILHHARAVHGEVAFPWYRNNPNTTAHQFNLSSLLLLKARRSRP